MNVRRRNSILVLIASSVLVAIILLVIVLQSPAEKKLISPHGVVLQPGTHAVSSPPSFTTARTENTFVTRSEDTLMLSGKPFRFSGANIYWLGLLESSTGVSYPSHFEVDDALATASLMGATVVRAHTMGISVGCSLCMEPALNVFNQTAIQHVDYALLAARQHHIRLIIPLTDNWHYYHGGKHNFTDWRGIANEQGFYYDQRVISDFEMYISFLLHHVNSYTGVAYKDDPTIMAWETGNELSAPPLWVGKIASYIKSIDHHHLVMDGNYEQANQFTNYLRDLSIPTVDIYTGHYYPPALIALNMELTQVRNVQKVFVVGEYDWNTDKGDPLKNFLSTIEGSTIAGDLYWSLFPHADQHGFVDQNEHFTLHYPGSTADRRARTALLVAHAYTMQGRVQLPVLVPGAPLITAIDGMTITWRGGYGVVTYSIERAARGANGPWMVICNRCTTDFAWSWNDYTQPSGTVAYRMVGYSATGVPGPYSPVFWKQ